MRRASVTYLLLGVGLSSLLWPIGSLLLLQIIDPYLIAQTERELGAQAALVAELYRSARASVESVSLGDPRPPERYGHSFVPNEVRLRDPDAVAPALPESLPTRDLKIPAAYARLSVVLQNAQIFNLSGIRVLDETGCAVASSREQIGTCFGALPEVQMALSGLNGAALRLRKSDEPTPPVGSIRRRGDRRVFLARPVFQDGKIWGVIWLSRTSESSLEFLYKERRGLLFGAGFVLLGLGISTWFFARRIISPLRLMESRIDAPRPEPLAEIDAPREVHALGVAIDQLTARLLDRERYIRQFAENVSHELKTPLTSIHGAVELLTLHSDMPRK